MNDRARQAYRAGGFVATTGAMLPMFLARMALAPEATRAAIRDRWVRRWARRLLDLFAIDLAIEGHVPPVSRRGERGRLIVSNHRSAVDIGLVLATFGGTLVSRADIGGWPVIGPAARAVGTVFVDRSDAKSGAAVIRAIQKQLEDGQTIALFPEGTTFAGDEVRPFHGGGFIAAARADAEVLPVGIAYPSASGAAYVDETFVAHLGRMAKTKSTRAGVSVGAPFRTTGMRGADVTRKAHAEVTRLVARARALAGP